MSLYLFDYYVPWWVLAVILVVTVILGAGLLYWYYRPTF
jgi:hypothetical protein